MAMREKPFVRTYSDGGKFWEHTYEKFYLKAYVPANDLDGQTNNYSFRAPLLIVFEENRMEEAEAVAFAESTGLAGIAASADAGVLFVYPTCEGGWKNADEKLYIDLIGEVKMDPRYADGMVEVTDFFTGEFQGYYVKGTKFRTDIYSYGESADYVAEHLLQTIQGEFLWGPGEITPAMCSMERLSVIPKPQRIDIAVISVGNDASVNEALKVCDNLLVKNEAEYQKDFSSFVWKFKMWCGQMQLEPDFDEMRMTEEAGSITVHTSSDNRIYAGKDTHKVGYFAYYNHGLLDVGSVPLLIGFHGGGDSAMFLTFVSGWYEIAHKYGFLYVAIENHQAVTATEAAEVIEELKHRYPVDEHRIYATGFSMGSGKTWDMFQEYPEIFAGMAPTSALFPMGDHPLAQSHGGRFNTSVPVPMFYSGGELSHVPELPFQAQSALERIQYAAKVNGLRKTFDHLIFEEKDSWVDPVWGVSGDRVEVLADESRGSSLKIHYFDSEDGVCRTAFASVSGQVHECRQHTCENAWKFISQFTKQ